MADPLSRLLDQPGAQELCIPQILTALPTQLSEDERIKIIAEEIGFYHAPARELPPLEVITEFPNFYPSIEVLLTASRRFFLIHTGDRFRPLDTPEQLKELVDTWIQQHQSLETLAIPCIFLPFLPPEIIRLKQLRTINFGTNKIQFLPYLLMTFPKLEQVIINTKPLPRMPIHHPFLGPPAQPGDPAGA